MTSSAFLLAAVFGLGGPELLLIFALMLLLFGAKKLPDLAKGLGKSIKEFKKASHEAEAEEEAAEAAKAAALESKKPEPAKVGHSSGTN